MFFIPRTSLRFTCGGLKRNNQRTSRVFSNLVLPITPRFRARGVGVATIVAGVVGGGLIYYNQRPLLADAQLEDLYVVQRRQRPLSSLVRSYLVFSICSVPTLVDWSPTILAVLTSIPGIKQLTEEVTRATFFSQFVGGDSAQGTVPVLKELRSENKGVLFAYSVEVDESEAAGRMRDNKLIRKPIHKQIVDEMVRSIDVAADFEDAQRRAGVHAAAGRRTWVAVKLTALLPDAQSLINLSRHLINTRPPIPVVPFPGYPHSTDLDVLNTYPQIQGSSPLTLTDIAALKELHSDLLRICKKAQDRGVRIVIDAEYSWYQPAIDAFTLSLTRLFNILPPRLSLWSRALGQKSHVQQDGGVQPLIYGTYQAYLRRTLPQLVQSFADARAGNYSLGVKLVRGAYYPHELEAHSSLETNKRVHPDNSGKHASLSLSPESDPPVWLGKHLTDAQYNMCVKALVRAVASDLHDHGDGATPRIGVLFGTHNWESCDNILNGLVEEGLAAKEPPENEKGREVVRIGEDVAERVTVGQLYGMCDALTDSLVDRTRCATPFVIKYVPYGTLSEVMPYLSRRAIENKSVLGNGGADCERRRAGAEIWKRLFG